MRDGAYTHQSHQERTRSVFKSWAITTQGQTKNQSGYIVPGRRPLFWALFQDDLTGLLKWCSSAKRHQLLATASTHNVTMRCSQTLYLMT